MSNEAVSSNPGASAGGKAKLKSGVHSRDIKSGMTVGEVRKEYGAVFRIAEGAVAYSGTQQLTDDTIVTPDMTLEFVKKSGEKGIIAKLISIFKK